VRALPGVRRYPGTWLATSAAARRLHGDAEGMAAFVQFVGHPRSGHSLVGALLDAHRHVLVAHELDVLRYVEAGFDRDRLVALILRHQRARVAAGHTSGSGYSYAVPGRWQGRYERLEVVGDKKGGRSTRRLREQPGLLDDLAAAVRVPVKVIHVVRNPFDNIATMARRAPRLPLADHVESYFALAATVDAVAARLDPVDLHRVRHEDLVADVVGELAGLCRFLGVDPGADPGYLDACAGIVDPAPHHSRDQIVWPAGMLDDIAERAAPHDWLAGYRYDEVGA
jgi:hypothetical protein